MNAFHSRTASARDLVVDQEFLLLVPECPLEAQEFQIDSHCQGHAMRQNFR